MTETRVQVYVDGVDVSCHVLEPVKVSWGRDHPGDSFEPRRLTATFDDVAAPTRGQTVEAVLQDPTADTTWAAAVGTWAAQTGTWAGMRVDITVFSGKVTDTVRQWDYVHVDGEDEARWGSLVDVTAMDPLAELTNQIVGDTPWPQESISARAARIQALTPLTWTTQPSAKVVAARDVDAQPAYGLLDDLAHWGSLAGGLFYDPNTLEANFLLDATRNSTTPDVTVDACSISAEAQNVLNATDVINDVAVQYVDPANPDAQPSAHVVNTTSVSVFGRRARSISTELVNSADALDRAATEATRFGSAEPGWEGVRIGTTYGAPSAAIAKALLGAGPGLRVRLDDLPVGTDPTWDGYLEGWGLEARHDGWDVDLNLSPAHWSGPLLKWGEVSPHQRWADVLRPWTWQQALAVLPDTITSPRFEDWLAPTGNPNLPDGQPVGWGLFWVSGLRAPIRKGPAQEGSLGLRWGPTRGGTVGSGPSSAQRLMSTAWPVVPGATVRVAILAKRDTATCRIELDVLTAPHSNPQPFGADTTLQVALAATDLSAAYVQYEGTVVVPAGHTFAVFSPLLSALAIGRNVDVDSAQAN